MLSYEKFVVCYNEVIIMYPVFNVILTVYHKVELVEKIQECCHLNKSLQLNSSITLVHFPSFLYNASGIQTEVATIMPFSEKLP